MICVRCGKPFDPTETGRRKYCSALCAGAAKILSRRRARRRRMKALVKSGARITRDRFGRLYTPEWQVKKARLLYGHACRMCGRPWRKGRHALDHRLPVAFVALLNDLLEAHGQPILDADEDDNLQPLCKPCHTMKSRFDAHGLALLRRTIT